MSTPTAAQATRARDLGILINDYRTFSHRSLQDCAQAMGISSEQFQDYENGSRSPSLPEIEVLAYYLNVSVDKFLSPLPMKEVRAENQIPHPDQLIRLRQKMIGAALRQARLQANFSPADMKEKVGIPESDLQTYELGMTAIPIDVLENISAILGSNLDIFRDRSGRVAVWMKQQRTNQQLQELPLEFREFISTPENHPTIRLAMQLSELTAEELRFFKNNFD